MYLSFVACTAPSHYLHQCSFIVHRKPSLKFISKYKCSFKKKYSKMSSAKWRPFSSGLNVYIGAWTKWPPFSRRHFQMFQPIPPAVGTTPVHLSRVYWLLAPFEGITVWSSARLCRVQSCDGIAKSTAAHQEAARQVNWHVTKSRRPTETPNGESMFCVIMKESKQTGK